MTFQPAHSGMLIMLLALTGLALGSGPGVAANGEAYGESRAVPLFYP